MGCTRRRSDDLEPQREPRSRRPAALGADRPRPPRLGRLRPARGAPGHRGVPPAPGPAAGRPVVSGPRPARSPPGANRRPPPPP
jgi:hypothetical protein